MAHYEHLPIYKRACDLAWYFEKIERSFSRYHIYTLGTELREKSREILQLIRQANNTTEKDEILLQLRERLEDLKLTIRLYKDLQAFAVSNLYPVHPACAFGIDPGKILFFHIILYKGDPS